MTRCIGLTTKDQRCKNAAQVGKVCCNIHKNQTPIPLYNRPDQNWPTPGRINKVVYMYYSVETVIKVMHNFNIDMHINSINLFHTPTQIDIAQKLFMMLITETLKRNKHICYGVHYLNDIITIHYDILMQFPQLADYAEDFRKQCLKSYRDKARKKLIMFYFQHCEGLCYDVVEHIMTFY
jgi:hypothetical protein